MNKNIILLIGAAIIPLAMGAVSELTAQTKAGNEATKIDYNNISLKMFREVSKLEGSNTFFSPLSFNMVLGMLYNGATGENRNEIVNMLGEENFSEAEINKYYKNISQTLHAADSSTEISIANSIWYRNDFSVKKNFVEITKNYFDAEVKPLDFNKPTAANIINNWCAEKTNNKITEIIDEIQSNAVMYLINATYFKSKWHNKMKFDKKMTKLDDFTKTNNQKIKVNMMEQTSSMNYYEDDDLQSVELDYGNRAFGMTIILPKSGNINQFIENFNSQKLQNTINNSYSQRVFLKLPRFKIEDNFSLKEPVRALGIERMFVPGVEFKNIADANIYVSDILQKTFVEVTEEGTEAAAVTAAIMTLGATAPSKPVNFFANRPFLYLIREKSSGIILFIGRMDAPIVF